ncbi:MAG: hypothetical protein WAK16_00535 [Candidatus Cybelea sp.]
MRYTLVRIWAVLTVGLLAGVLGDAGTEFCAMFGWLGGTTRDVDHQGILPALAITLALALGLAAYIIGSRIAPGDPLVRRLDDGCARTVDAIAAFAGSCLTVLAIEGYETHFGGLAPFDANSIVIAHAPVLIVTFLTIAVAARIMLGAAIRCAASSAVLAAVLFTSFLRISRSLPATPKHATRPHPEMSGSHVAPEILKSRGLRAPPRTLPALA